MSDVTSMWMQLRAHRILLDTLSDMEPKPTEFFNAFAPTVQRDPVLTTSVVLSEPTDFSVTAELNCAGRRAMEQIIHSYFQTFTQIPREMCGNIRDQVILPIPFPNQRRKHIVARTSHCDLLDDMPQIWSAAPFKSGRTLDVLKLNSHGFRESSPCFE